MPQTVMSFIMSFLIALFCAACSLRIFFVARRYADHTHILHFFTSSLLCLFTMAITDALHTFWSFGIANFPDCVNNCIDSIYLLACIFGAFFWFMYSEYRQNTPFSRSKICRAALVLLVGAFTVLAVLNPFFEVFFDYRNGEYSRGPLYILAMVLNGILLLAAGIAALVRSFMNRFYEDRAALRYNFLASVIFLAGHFFQYFFPELPIRTMFFTVVFALAQAQILKSNVYRDRTARINNRLSMESYLSAHFRDAGSGFLFGLLSIDIPRKADDESRTADVDRVLFLTAKALKATSGSAFVARFRNGEFAFSGNFETDREIDVFLAAFAKKLRQSLEDENMDCELSFRGGCARKADGPKVVPDLIALARDDLKKNQRTLVI